MTTDVPAGPVSTCARLIGACTAAALLALSPSAWAIVGGSSDPGDAAVVHLPARNCSGTLVGARAVLTAAHCEASAGDEVAFGSGATALALAVHPAPAWDPSTLADDLAVVVLDRASPVAPVPLSRTPLDDSFVGRAVRIVGWGSAGDAGAAGVLRTGTTTLSAYLDTTFVVDDQPDATCAGDSGGPALLDLGAGEVVVGVTSRGDHACAQFGVDTRVDAYVVSFLAPAIAATAPGSRKVGQACDFDEACASGTCAVAVDSPLVHYCSAPCSSDPDCPPPMRCTGGSCRYAPPSPGALGSPCDLDGDCAGGLCVAQSPGGSRTCGSLCDPSAPAPCTGSFSCAPVWARSGVEACFPAPPTSAAPSASGSCALTRAGAPGDGAGWLLAVALGCALRRRIWSRQKQQ